jgi:hypothetical protein
LSEVKIRSFKQWKAEVMLWLSSVETDNVDAKRLVLILSQKLPSLRIAWLPYFLSQLIKLKQLGVNIPQNVFPNKNEIDAWHRSKSK